MDAPLRSIFVKKFMMTIQAITVYKINFDFMYSGRNSYTRNGHFKVSLRVLTDFTRE